MNDLLQGRKTYEPLNGFAGARTPAQGFAFQTTVKSTSSEKGQHDCTEQKPSVELIEANGRIQQIVVQCGCGERITLNCTY